MLVTRPVLGRSMLVPLWAPDRGHTESVVGGWMVGANRDGRKNKRAEKKNRRITDSLKRPVQALVVNHSKKR